LLKEKTKKRVAYHEAGHAVSNWFLKGGNPLLKLTIIPRSKGALGYAQYLPKTTHLMSKDEMIDRTAILLGGIMSEIMFFGDMSSGGSDDLQKVYQLTRAMVTQYGMG
jgi:AFG3 family protein